MNLDDPKLTAFALNELDEPERSQVAQAIAESPEAQRAVDETRERLVIPAKVETIGRDAFCGVVALAGSFVGSSYRAIELTPDDRRWRTRAMTPDGGIPSLESQLRISKHG